MRTTQYALFGSAKFSQMERQIQNYTLLQYVIQYYMCPSAHIICACPYNMCLPGWFVAGHWRALRRRAHGKDEGADARRFCGRRSASQSGNTEAWAAVEKSLSSALIVTRLHGDALQDLLWLSRCCCLHQAMQVP